MASLVRVRAAYPDGAEQQQAQHLLIINLAWIVALGVGIPFVILVVIAGSLDAGSVFLPLSLALAALIHRLIQRGQLATARWLFVGNILVAALLANFPEYRLDSPFVIVLILPLTAAGVLLGRGGLLSVTLLVIAVVTVGGLLQISTDMAPTPLGSTAAEGIGTTILLVALVAAFNSVMLRAFLGSAEVAVRRQRQLGDVIDRVHQVGLTLVAVASDDEALTRAIEQLREMFDLYHVQVFLADPSSGLAVLRASTGYIGRRLLEEDSLSMPAEDSPVNDALRRKDPLLIRDTDPMERRAGFLPATQSELLLPLRVGDLLPLGVLDLHSASRDAFSPEQLNALLAIGSHMAATLYGAQQAREVRAAFEERERLVGQIEAGQRELARMNRQLVGTTWGAYLEGRQNAVPGFDWHNGAVAPSQTPSEVIRQTLGDGQPRLVKRGGETVLCVPIRLRGQTLGALEFRRPGEAGWSAQAVELAQAVAERLALSLENTRLFEQAQITAQREQLVNRITARLQTAGDLDGLLTMAAAQFQEALGATRAQVRLGLPPAPDAEDEA
jgi:GAF domain-containing protein